MTSPAPTGWPRLVVILALLMALAAGGFAWWTLAKRPDQAAAVPAAAHGDAGRSPQADDAAQPDRSAVITFPRESWSAASIEIEPARVDVLEQQVTLTGKITLNEDRVAHIYPLVDGRIDAVNVGLGDRVKQGQEMAIIQSRDAGEAMLQLVQDRLQLSFAQRQNTWMQSVAENTQTLISLLRSNAPIEQIETEMRNRPLGEYRERLMTAYIANDTARKNLDRLTPLQGQGIVAARQIFEAEAAWTTARATLRSLLEQVEQDARQAAIVAGQRVQELETRVSVDETALKILGFDDAAIRTIDPSLGEALSHCPIHAPFDGTVISKDVALMEHVGPDNQILSVADLGTVWLSTDIYEEHLPLLAQITDKTISFRSAAWPGETFAAKIFYTGDIVDSATRTISMRAWADNAAGKLKPGMFVTVNLPGSIQATALQVPRDALLEHEGKSFVFVHTEGDSFRRRDVRLGRATSTAVEILEGIAPGDAVVVNGGFALKSRMLAELLSE